MNRLTGAEAAVLMLSKHGVEVIFGLCGDTSLPFYDALFRLDHGMKHVLTRDERSAGYMADVYARVSGRIGVCEGPSGGGATYITPALVEANDSSSPMLAITSDIAVSARGRHALTELDQAALFRPLTKWNAVISTAASVPHLFRRGVETATSGKPGSVHLGLPIDVQRESLDETNVWATPSAEICPSRRTAPDPSLVDAAARLFAEARRPVIIAGGGPVISGAAAELQTLAELTGSIVLTSVSGKGAIVDDHPLAAGVVGSNGGTIETRALAQSADLVVFIGCRAGSVTTEKWRFPAQGASKVIHIDVDADLMGLNYPTDVAIVSDAKLALAALNACVRRASTERIDQAAGAVAAATKAKFDRFSALAMSDETPIRPERIVAALNRLLSDDAIIVADPGTPCPYFSAYYRSTRAGRQFVTNRAHGALGYSLPGVVGAQFARPDAKCVAVMGDGSFGFSVGELETIMRYNLPVTLIVISNASYGWIKAGQKTSFGKRYFSVDFNATDHAAIAKAYGLRSWRVDDPRSLEATLKTALATDGPTLVDIVAQPLQDAQAPVSEWIA